MRETDQWNADAARTGGVCWFASIWSTCLIKPYEVEGGDSQCGSWVDKTTFEGRHTCQAANDGCDIVTE